MKSVQKLLQRNPLTNRIYRWPKSYGHTICKSPDMASFGNLYWGYPLINGVDTWCQECGHIAFPGSTFWYAASYLIFQPLHKG